jgi:hypothetical protein
MSAFVIPTTNAIVLCVGMVCATIAYCAFRFTSFTYMSNRYEDHDDERDGMRTE